jgi:hypothetical protein
MEEPMDALLEKLDAKLKEWKPETAAEVRNRLAEMIVLADQDALDLMRSRAIEQEVLDMLDEPTAR